MLLSLHSFYNTNQKQQYKLSKIASSNIYKHCRVERSLLWEIMESLVATSNDLRVGNQLLYSKPKIIIRINRLQPYPH